MNQSMDHGQALTGAQLTIVSRLVGDAIAREDLPALEAAYRDFRDGMDELKSAFELALASGQDGFAGPAVAAHQEVKP